MRAESSANPRVFASEKAAIWRVLSAVMLAFWAVAALLLIVSPEGLTEEAHVVPLVYWTGAIFAAAAIAQVVLRRRHVERTLWIVLGGGLLLKLAGDASRNELPFLGLHPLVLGLDKVDYLVSSLLIFGALLWLVARTSTNVTVLSVVGTLSLTLSVGILVSYFVLGVTTAETGPAGWREILAAFSGPGLSWGIVYPGLLALMNGGRLRFTKFLVGALMAFGGAEILYLWPQSPGPGGVSGWPELVRALGAVLLGLAALSTTSFSGFAPRYAISWWCSSSFWFSPISPVMQYGFLLVWTAFNPPLPRYAALGGAVLMVLLAFRMSAVSYSGHKLSLEAERRGKTEEQSRISSEMHDTLKQSVHSTALMLGAYREARKRGDSVTAEEAVNRAIEASQEANYQVNKPIDELRVLSMAPELDLTSRLYQLLTDVSKHFEIKAHADLRADLTVLNVEESAAVYRIASEALWNASKHSGGENVWLETRETKYEILVRVRDDGRGFFMDDFVTGLGLSLMRTRAERSRGELEIVSEPSADGSGGGTLVQLRFDRSEGIQQ